ncbi:MAG: hypothetical protein ABL958_16695 [Bdellovibrionia bacterium]
MKNTLDFLFGMKERVAREPYIKWGFALMALKYAGEVGLYYLSSERFLTPLNFLSPVITLRYPNAPVQNVGDWFIPAIVLWSLPFVWIGVGMSIRRAADAGFSPWLGILFFIPGVNYLLMFGLCAVPTSPNVAWEPRASAQPSMKAKSSSVMSPILSTIAFALVGTLLVWFSTNALKVYLNTLFAGSPLILGLVQGYYLNSRTNARPGKIIGYVSLTVLLIHLLLLLFALEGVICLLMSLPLATPLAVIGAIFGAGIAKYGKPGRLTPTMFVLALPILPLVENQAIQPHTDVVLSKIEIAVSPEKVWPNVVKFSDLPPTNDWLFKLGVAHPIRARIDGTGPGAIRRCEFSTGAFVEPITAWEEPSRLAFDVQFQPQPMKELSFYDSVDAPHLNGYFRSVRGEFRLIPTADGRTILEGRTWYEMDIHPGWYWQIYGRWFIHKIHLRVLDHIKNLSEKV